MSQHDFNIANQTFPNFRADLNNALVAAATMSAGASAPTTPYAYQLWFDTTTGTWKVRNSGNTAWVSTITTDLATGNVGIGAAAHASAALLLSTTNQHIRLDNGGELGVIELESNGDLNIWAHGDGETINLKTGSGAGTDVLSVVGNNVGIGTASPDETVQVFQTADSGNNYNEGTLKVGGSTTALGFQFGYHSISSGRNVITSLNNGGGANQRISIGFGAVDSNGEPATNVMTINQAGNVLVGTTSSSLVSTSTETGAQIYDGGFVAAANDPVAYFNRITSDGDVAQFRKNGSALGSIGVYGSRIYYGNVADSGISFFQFSLIPTNAGGLAVDNTYDCGHSSYRWDDVYATNGTIQTSDANEKQQIAALTDDEMTAAKSISALFKTFKWNDAVEAKGDAARTHAGVIAQDVQAAMTAAGLDAGDYAFFISNTWWETQTEVPAVEAVDAVLDEDGNVVTKAVEAKEAYTHTDTYDTAEEAPSGATQRTRLGIRYPELLAFVGAATEQRLANIETRLAALEA